MGNASSAGGCDEINNGGPCDAACGVDPITEKETVRGSSQEQQIEYAVSGMKGHRNTMEDKYICCINIAVDGEPSLHDHSIFAVFDGHGGDFTSSYLQENFMKTLARNQELIQYAKLHSKGSKGRGDVNGIDLLKKALYETFRELDALLIILQKKRHGAIISGEIIPSSGNCSDDEDDINVKSKIESAGERSGSTAVVVLLTPTHFICANTGDSRAILRRNCKVLPLSFDHKPSSVPERMRIGDAGGVVKGKRIDGDLAVSRAFGDWVYKVNPDLSFQKQKITVEPDILVYPRDLKGDEFIVLACDGIFDVATNGDCSEFVQCLLAEGETNLANICEEALETCLDRNSRDNMTFILVGLPGIKANASSTAIMQNALWGYRASRRARKMVTKTSQVASATWKATKYEIGIEQEVCA